MQHPAGSGRGSGSSGPPLSCQELDPREHWVLHEISKRTNRDAIDFERTCARLGAESIDIRDALDGLVDAFLLRNIPERGGYIRSVLSRCGCVKPPGQNPFLPGNLTTRGLSHLSGGLGATKELATESTSPSAEGGDADIDTEISKIDIPAEKLQRITRGYSKAQTAFGLVRYFTRQCEAATDTRWAAPSSTEQHILHKEVNRWLKRDGATRVLVQEMMRLFFTDVESGRVNAGRLPLWRAFIATKTEYHRRATIALDIEDDDDSGEDSDTETVRPPSILITRREYEERRRS